MFDGGDATCVAFYSEGAVRAYGFDEGVGGKGVAGVVDYDVGAAASESTHISESAFSFTGENRSSKTNLGNML